MATTTLRRLIPRWDLSDQARAAYRDAAAKVLTRRFKEGRHQEPLLRAVLPQDLGLEHWEFKTINKVLPAGSDLILTSVALVGPDIQESIVDTMLNIEIGFARYYSFSLASLAMPFLLLRKLPRTWKAKPLESLLPEGWLSEPLVIDGGYSFQIHASLPVRLLIGGLIAEPIGMTLA